MAVRSLKTGVYSRSLLVGNPYYVPQVGSFESISTVTVSSNTSTITLSSIPSTYKHLHIRASLNSNTTVGAGSSPLIRINADSGSNYANHSSYGSGASVGAWGYASNAGGFYCLTDGGSYFATNIIDILDYTSTNKYKTFKVAYGADSNGGGYVGTVSGLWMNTAAVTSITFDMSPYVFQAGTKVALYGLKDA